MNAFIPEKGLSDAQLAQKISPIEVITTVTANFAPWAAKSPEKSMYLNSSHYFLCHITRIYFSAINETSFVFFSIKKSCDFIL